MNDYMGTTKANIEVVTGKNPKEVEVFANINVNRVKSMHKVPLIDLLKFLKKYEFKLENFEE